MTRRNPMSEREAMYFVCFLLPPLWILGIAMLIGDAAQAIGHRFREWQFQREQKRALASHKED